jgi:signal transduction histidine kinase
VFSEARLLRQTTALRVDTTAVSAGRINGDASAMRRILTNLGNNAARHAASTIAFSLIETTAGVQLTIDDDGPGIPEPDRERILQRFVRLDDARNRDAGGSGLGLAIVAELVAAHDGTLHVESSPAGGARFRVTLATTVNLGEPAFRDTASRTVTPPRI